LKYLSWGQKIWRVNAPIIISVATHTEEESELKSNIISAIVAFQSATTSQNLATGAAVGIKADTLGVANEEYDSDINMALIEACESTGVDALLI
jgi:hypothetical protein